AVVLDGRGTRLVDLGPVAGLNATIDAALFGLRRLARPGGSPAAVRGATVATRAALATLSRRLLAPLAIATGAPVVVVPVGDLQRIPWAPLHDGPTTVVPSAAMWLRTAGQPRTPGQPRITDHATPAAPQGAAGPRVAIIAGPGVPGALEEATVIAARYVNAALLAPPESSCRAVAALLQAVDVAHFACHGRLRADNPAFSALLLSDGPLTVHELTRRGSAPATVVLAACESGAQVGFTGGEALGFVSALLAGGSTGVIASSVLVSDDGTSPLMVAVHESLAGGSTVGEALWSARQRADLDDSHQLASWCAFDAYGAG
ncbi:MAG: hypothetical protein QOH99_1589, partial [Frankiaceae bacterium]|nr:hypothetical protein [Frankiaceae bacterium]